MLNGAPGSGKGTIAEFVMKARHITHIAVSDLLHLPEHETVKNTAELVNDAEVLQILLEELLKPKHEHGVVIDGFPRTPVCHCSCLWESYFILFLKTTLLASLQTHPQWV